MTTKYLTHLALVCSFCCTTGLVAQQKPTGLICNLLVRPELTAITQPVPQFGWVLPPEANNRVQTAYRLVVASTPEQLNRDQGDCWDSGKVASNQSQQIPYGGKALEPQSTYYWKVAYWNAQQQASPFSEPQTIHTGVFNQPTAWPGESKWVKVRTASGDQWALEDRNPLAYHPVYAQKIQHMPNGNWFVDFARAAFAYPQLTLNWAVPNHGQQLTLTVWLGEKAAGDSIDRAPGGGVLCNQYPLTIQPGLHTYTLPIPRFVSRYPHSQAMPPHLPEVIPFRYAEIGNTQPALSLVAAQQLALHTVYDDSAATFGSSCALLNQVYDLCRYSVIANTFNGDYAARKRERMMYEADGYIHQLGHYAVDREYSVARYSLKNMIYHATWPTEWIPHAIMMAWADYLHTGNSDLLKEYYTELKPKTLEALTTANGLISTRTGLQNPALFKAIHFDGKELKDIVDWPHGSMSNTREGGETDGYDFKDYNTVVNAFHYHALVRMAQIAAVVGEQKDQAHYRQKAATVKAAVNNHLVDRQRGIYIDGIGSAHASLHANLFALAFGLVPDSLKSTVKAYIKDKRMACGVYGANYLLEALFDEDETAHALSLLTDTTDRSWYNMMRVGSTITTEAWDNRYKTNNGWSHAWSSSPAHLLPRKILGIEPLTPGFETIRIHPRPGWLEQAHAKLPTIRGTVEAQLTNLPKQFVLEVVIPGNTKAEVSLPVRNKISRLLVDGQTRKHYRQQNNRVYIGTVGSGKHRFAIEYE